MNTQMHDLEQGLPITTACVPTASARTARLFKGLNPRGKLVVGNCLQGTPDLGWMEALLDWYLIYRTQADIKAFANRIPEERIARMHGYICPTGCVGYLGLRRV